MKSTIFPIPLPFFMITNLLLSITFPEYVYGVDDQPYSSCSSSFNCGKFKDIGYPFWTNDQPEYCGHPGFKLENCEEPNVTMDAFSWKYRVIEIHPENQILKLARIDFLESICPASPETFVNNTLNKNLFSYTSNDEYATLLYNCEPTTEFQLDNKFSCPINNVPQDAYFINDPFLSGVATILGCNITLSMPVLVTSVQGFLSESLDIYQVISGGFEVRWNIDAVQCSQCIKSGGKCGYNITVNAFSCFCPDKAYARACRGPQPPPATSQPDDSADAPVSHPVKGLRNMNNHDLFPTLILHFTITIFFFLIVLPLSHCYDDEDQFSNCSSPYLYRCGSSVLDISYPFWGGNRPEYCGHKGFEIECHDYGYHFIDLKTQKFGVLNIDAPHRIMTIARDDLWNGYCPGILTQHKDIDPSRFKYTQNVRNVSFFHGCDDQNLPPDSPNIFNCTGEAGFYTVKVDKPELQLHNLTNTCGTEIKVPVLLSTLDDLVRPINLQELLNKGFEVEYMAEDKLCAACNSSGGICGSDSASSEPFRCFCRDHDEPHEHICPPPDSRPNKKMKAIIGVTAGFGGMIIMAVVSLIWVRYYRKKHAPSLYTSRNISSDPSSVADLEKADKFLGVHLFTYSELEVATNNFDSAKELGDGGFGTVYYGKLRDGRAVAVKRLYENNYKRVEQFMNEVEILAHLRHRNLVTLYGCTSRHCRELLLVYEFVSNGTVADHLHGERAKPGALPWATRLNIAIETASALQYLHASTIIHRDVKTNNILLDNNFCVKVADFGLSRLFPDHVTHVSTAPQGTPGYVDPEYHQCYQLTDKSDVFSFGVVLVELISSKPAVDITRHRHEINLSNLFINKIQNKALHELVDPYLGFESDYKVRTMIYAVAELAFQCLQGDKDFRPSMATVLETLKDIESDGYSKDKAEELDISDDVGLLKNGPPTPSPDSRTSAKTTPPTSN